MNMEIRRDFLNYLNATLAQTDWRIRGYIIDENGQPFSKRSAFLVFKKFIEEFLRINAEPRWIVMPGLRGVGKTTLMAQLFSDVLTGKDVLKLYISIDEVVRRFNATIWDIIDGYETLIGKRLEELNKKLFLFFDEVQYDEKWDAAIKTIYDRSKNIFILCTGSSALMLREKINADISRRAYFEELYPLDFKEYIKLKFNRYPQKGLSEKIKKILFFSKDAEEIFKGLSAIEKDVKEYWIGIDLFEINKYLKFGTFPFTIKIKEDVVILNQLDMILQKIIYSDISNMSNFDKETLNKIYSLIYLLSGSFEISLTKLSTILDISKDTLSLVLKSLENAGILLKISPYGSHYKQIRKPYRYLFSASAFRFLLLTGRESITNFENFKGLLLEDVTGLYLRKIFRKFINASITYDSSKGGANFIVKIGDKKIVIEVGYGKKKTKQVEFTLKRINGNYGMVISFEENLTYNDKIVKVPLKYFLLL